MLEIELVKFIISGFLSNRLYSIPERVLLKAPPAALALRVSSGTIPHTHTDTRAAQHFMVSNHPQALFPGSMTKGECGKSFRLSFAAGVRETFRSD